MRVLCESVGFLPENGRFSVRIKGNQAGKCRWISGFLMRGRWSLIAVDAVYKPFFS